MTATNSRAASQIDDPALLIERALYRLSLVKRYDSGDAKVGDPLAARTLMLGFTKTDLNRALALVRGNN